MLVTSNQTNSLLKDLPHKYDAVRSALGKVQLPKSGVVTKGGLALALVQTGVIAIGGMIANQLNTASVPEVYVPPLLPPAYKQNKARRGRGGYGYKYHQYNRSYKKHRCSPSGKYKRRGNRFNCKRNISSRRSKSYFGHW